MALAETARLLATYEVQDKSAQGIRSATTGLTGLQARARTFGSTIKTHVGGALTHFGGQLKNIASIGLASLGVAGLFGVVGAFRSVITEAREFGEEVYRLQAITNLSAEATSRLTDALGDFGVDSSTALRVAGLFEKNVQRLGGTQEKAAKFTKDYGLNLLDSKGHVVDFNEALLRGADYFEKQQDPAKRSAALAALFGRNWQALIPILKQGRDGLQDTLDTSLTLSQDEIKAIEDNRIATRKWNDAIGDLQVKIGVGLLPTVTELVTSLTGWVTSHGPEIQQFFKDGVNTAKAIGGAVVSVVGGIKNVWDSIPGPVRDLLIKGIVAERTFKFLFGVSPIQIAANVAGGALEGIGKGLFGGLFQRGSSPANPMWVAPVGGGLGGGPGGAAAGGGLPIVGALGVAGAAVVAAHDAPLLFDAITSGINAVQNKEPGGILKAMRSIATDMAAIPQFIKDFAKGKFDEAATKIGQEQSAAAVKEAGSEKGRADDKRESNRISAQAGTRPLIDKLEKQHADLTKIRDVNEKNRIATVTGLNRTTAATREGLAQTRRQLTAAQQGAANRMTAAQHSAADRIVRALYATRNVSVNVTLAQRGGAAAVASSLFIPGKGDRLTKILG